jgi:hypothetical protein
MENEQDKQPGPEGASQAPQDPAQQVSRGDTLASAGSVPVDAPPRPAGAEIVGASGGTDAAAGAKMSGSSGPGGISLREEADAAGVPGSPGGSFGGGGGPAAGAGAAGGTSPGEAADAGTTGPGVAGSEGAGLGASGGNPAGGAPRPPAGKDGGSGA